MKRINTQQEHGFKIFIGDRNFYKKTAAIVIPIIIQNTISNVVSFLDNIMVGTIGKLPMSAVAIVNQLVFVFSLCIFGGLAGAGIFSTQYVGAGDTNGVRYCFRIKMWIAGIMSAIALFVFSVFSSPLINMYLNESKESAAIVYGYSIDYLHIIVLGMIPFAVSCVYAMTLRENGETKLPMIASIAAIIVNLVFNWLLIFGNLGFPRLGVIGAAIATVLSRFIELGIIVSATHLRSNQFTFIKHAYRSFKVPISLVKQVIVKGTPLLVNEFLWSAGMAAMLACYSLRSIDAVAACNIASTVNNLFNVVFISMGNAIAIMVGQALGANDNENAMGLSWKLMATSVFTCLIMGGLMFILAPIIPEIYNADAYVKNMAADLLRILAIMMPVFAVPHCCYFTLRSGGRTMITFLFDSLYTWVVACTCAYALCHYTNWPLVPIYACVQSLDIIKGVIGIILVKKGIWLKNIVE